MTPGNFNVQYTAFKITTKILQELWAPMHLLTHSIHKHTSKTTTTMARVFSRQKRHPFAEAQPPEMAPAASSHSIITMDQWNDIKEMDPPKEVLASYTKQQQSSPARSKSATTISSEGDENDDFALSCTGLLGEELLMDTAFGQYARASLEATAESLRKLSEAVIKPINKNSTDEESEKQVVLVDHEALLQENEQLKRENTWLQEENESLRGGAYDEEEDIRSQRTGKSV